MKSWKTFCLVVASLFFAFGCAKRAGLPKPEGIFPDSVGKYKLSNAEDGREDEYQNEKNLRQKFQSWGSIYTDGENRIRFIAAVHKTAEDATNELGFLTDCYGTDRKLQMSNKIREKIPLKDKSGKEVGLMTICLKPSSKVSYENKGLGDYDYVYSFSNGNRTYTPKPVGADKAADVAEFIKALPFNSEVDLSMLDSLASPNNAKALTDEDMFKNLPPVKLAAKPYLKGKILVLQQKPLKNKESATYISNVTDYYITDADQQAIFPGEIGSIVRIDCKKGNKVGVYSAGAGVQVPAFGSICELIVIDNSIPAIIAKKTFTNNDLADMTMLDTDKKGELTDKEYIVPYPQGEIKSFIAASLPKK